METVGHQLVFPLLGPLPVPPASCMPITNPVQAGEAPPLLLATAAPAEHLPPPVTWLDNLERKLTTYFTKTHSPHDCSPCARNWTEFLGRSVWAIDGYQAGDGPVSQRAVDACRRLQYGFNLKRRI